MANGGNNYISQATYHGGAPLGPKPFRVGILGDVMQKSFSTWFKSACALTAAVVLFTMGSALAIGKVGEMAADWSGLKDLP